MKLFRFTYTTLTPKTAKVNTKQCLFHAKDETNARVNTKAFVKIMLGHSYLPDTIEVESTIENHFFGVVIIPKELPQRITVLSGELHEYTEREAEALPEPKEESEKAVDALKNGKALPAV